MATVPGAPVNGNGNDPYGGIPVGLRPGYPELLMAAAIHKQQQDQKLAGDVIPFSRPPPKPGEAYESAQKGTTRRALSRVLEMESNVTPIKPEDK
jgi:hypothetical protein